MCWWCQNGVNQLALGWQSCRRMKLLALDDDTLFLKELGVSLRAEGFEFHDVNTPAEAMRRLENETFDAVLLDMHMPEISGLQMLKLVRGRWSETPVVMLTGDSNPESIVSAVQMGASDYVVKGSEEFLFALMTRLARIRKYRQLKSDHEVVKQKLAEADRRYEILGISSAVLKQRLEIARFKGTNVYVLIEGENGTGKELVARNLNLQEGVGRPFVAVNCGAIPTHLFESELFGHVKGSFTGAVSDQKGKFLAAQGGDLFLDEIGEMPLEMQVKLLRALQEKTITPVGSTRSIPVDVRILAATNRGLEDMVRQGKFRQDLFFRINQITLRTAPLRERPEDIGYLADLFAKRLRPGSMISPAALRRLEAHRWPGNVRELSNAIERACLYARDVDAEGASSARASVEILPEHLLLSDLGVADVVAEIPLLPQRAEDVTKERYQACLDWMQRRFFEVALDILKDNDTVIRRLEISRSYFYQKKKDLGLVANRRAL